MKIFEPYYKMEVSKLHQLKNKTKNWKKKLVRIFYIEINEKVCYKILRKINIKNATRFF